MIDGRIKIDDRVLRAIEANLTKAHVKVGLLAERGAAEKHPDSDLSLLEIGAIHEFGNRPHPGSQPEFGQGSSDSPYANTPQRSFIRSAFTGARAEPKKHEALLQRLGKGVITGKLRLYDALEILGQWGVARVQENMARTIPPPLAASTLKARRRIQKNKSGSDKPLINTGRLRQAVAYIVKMGES